MLYASAGFLALIIHFIINHDVLWHTDALRAIPAYRTYRAYLFAVTVYYVSDILWGLLYERHLITLTFADTAVYFASMAFSILLWTHYVIDYLQEKSAFGKLLKYAGGVFFGYEIIAIVINFYYPVLFSFDAANVYHAEMARFITLSFQVIMFLMTAVYAFSRAVTSRGTMRLRRRTIGLSSLAMTGFILIQVCFPLLPLYAIGCMLSTCLLHSFVLENEKEEYRDQLEAQLQENILKGNYYDLLTGLPGMSYFFEKIQHRRAAMFAAGEQPVFLYMNLSGLKFYNQEHGFTEGDRLLRTFAQLLTAVFGDEQCSRFGQDHFAVLTRAEGLEDALQSLFSQWEQDGRPPILVGVYADAVESIPVNTACDMAKIACDAIESTHVSSIRYYDRDMFISAEWAQYITFHLDRAIEEKWIQVYFQPIVRASSGRVCDEEALARWIDPERGFLSPASFIPILEEAKLIYRLDLFVLDQVLEKLRRQRDLGLYLVPQSINLSRSDFDTCDIVEEIRRRVDASGFPRRLITVEITESVIGSDFDFIRSQVERFRELGFPVWMDDFGSGYSSLDVLQSMPVDLIKLDMHFMRQFDRGERNRIILTELMKMALGMGIDTVCEGVEREEQVDFLREIGCSKLQGYYYTRPIPQDEVFERYEKGVQIGFENPEESDYYDAIGRINLYDLSVIAKDDDDALQHYFSSVPMALIEVRDDRIRFARSNQSYRDFMERIFHVELVTQYGAYEESTQEADAGFAEAICQCCREGGRAVYDGHLADGTTIHAFMRRIAENQHTRTAAVAVAVLAVT